MQPSSRANPTAGRTSHSSEGGKAERKQRPTKEAQRAERKRAKHRTLVAVGARGAPTAIHRLSGESMPHLWTDRLASLYSLSDLNGKRYVASLHEHFECPGYLFTAAVDAKPTLSHQVLPERVDRQTIRSTRNSEGPSDLNWR